MDTATVLSDRFELLDVAGKGGMGTVYRARDLETGKNVAVKVLSPGVGHEQRFALEATILSELDHPAIVRFVAHGTSPQGRPYLVMEWLDGEDLAHALADRRLGIGASVAIVRQIAAAIGRAHEIGVVHRDIKPSNVYLVGADRAEVKILDFGIARLQRTSTRITYFGAAVGTPDYMAPEQARGDPDVDARADVFALGCVFFECLTGKLPFPGQHAMAVLAKIVFDASPRVREVVPEIPEPIDELVARMLAKERADRPDHGAAVVEALEAMGDVATEAGAPRPHSRPPPAPTSRRTLTLGERQLLSVIVVAGEPPRPEADASAPTMLQEGDADPLGAMDEIVTAHEGAFSTLLDGTVVATLTGRAPATDQAARAARCALALRDASPNARIALATGRGFVSGSLPVGDVIDRAVELVTSGRPASFAWTN